MDSRTRALWLACLEGDLADAGAEELEKTLGGSPALREKLYRDLQMASLLSQLRISDAEFRRSVSERLAAQDSNGAFVQCVLARLPGGQQKRPRQNRGAGSRSRRRANRTFSRLPVWLPLAAALGSILLAMHVINVRQIATWQERLHPIVSEVEGTARVSSTPEQRLLPGRMLQLNETVETGADGMIALQYPDGTTFRIRSDSHVTLLDRGSVRQGIELEMTQGRLSADVMPQPSEAPMLIFSRQAVAQVVGTRFDLHAERTHTRLDVMQGGVRLTRLRDRRSVLVNERHWADTSEMHLYAAPAGAGEPPAPVATEGGTSAEKTSRRFWAGVNFGGESVTIDGNRWMSEQEALQAGMTYPADIEKIPRASIDLFKPSNALASGMAEMLNTNIWSYNSSTYLEYPLPNGSYVVTLFVAENFEDHKRAFDIALEDKVVARSVGALQKGNWKAYGPYPVRILSEALRLNLRQKKDSPHLMGLLIERTSVD